MLHYYLPDDASHAPCSLEWNLRANAGASARQNSWPGWGASGAKFIEIRGN